MFRLKATRGTGREEQHRHAEAYSVNAAPFAAANLVKSLAPAIEVDTGRLDILRADVRRFAESSARTFTTAYGDIQLALWRES